MLDYFDKELLLLPIFHTHTAFLPIVTDCDQPERSGEVERVDIVFCQGQVRGPWSGPHSVAAKTHYRDLRLSIPQKRLPNGVDSVYVGPSTGFYVKSQLLTAVLRAENKQVTV